MAAVGRRRTIRRADPLSDVDIYILDLHDLPSHHKLRTATTRATLAEFEERRIKRNQITRSHQLHELGFYMLHGEAIVCSLKVTPRADHVAQVNNVDCHTAYGRVRPRSYVLFYTMAQLMKKNGVKYVSIQSHGEPTFFYKTLGFRSIDADTIMYACVSDIIDKTTRVFH